MPLALARFIRPALKWGAVGATGFGLFAGAKQGTERLFFWATVGSALYLLFQVLGKRS